MFQIVPARIDQRSQLNSTSWELDTVMDAVSMLGWHGELRGPVDFGGVRFVAVLGTDPFGAPGSGWLQGCLVSEDRPREAVRTASQLAGYSSRAVLLRSPDEGVELQLETALFDQGAVVEIDGELSLVSKPGPVVPSPLQDDDTWRTDTRWLSLRNTITAAKRLVTGSSS